jgi:hypothetical protein
LVALPQKTLLTRKLQRNQSDGLDNELDRKKHKRLGIEDTLKIATWSVRGLLTKEIELDKEPQEKKIKIAIITETKKKLKGKRILKTMLWYIMVWNRRKERVVE